MSRVLLALRGTSTNRRTELPAAPGAAIRRVRRWGYRGGDRGGHRRRSRGCGPTPEGALRIRGSLDEVAGLARACLDLDELTLAPRWLASARALGEGGLRHYRRSGGGGFFVTGDDAEALLLRVESQHDSAIPSGLEVIVEAPPPRASRGGSGGLAGSRAAVEATLMRYRSALGQPMADASLLNAALWAAPEAAKVEVGGGLREVAEFARVVRSERLVRPERFALRHAGAGEEGELGAVEPSSVVGRRVAWSSAIYGGFAGSSAPTHPARPRLHEPPVVLDVRRSSPAHRRGAGRGRARTTAPSSAGLRRRSGRHDVRRPWLLGFAAHHALRRVRL